MIVPIVVDIVACVFIADFLSGFFHWLEDAYGQEHWKVTGRHITLPNIRHHRDPGYFTRHNWFETARVLLVMGTAILIGAWMLMRTLGACPRRSRRGSGCSRTCWRQDQITPPA